MSKTQEKYQAVVDRLLGNMAEGSQPWSKPWDAVGRGVLGLPVSGATGKPYRGFNVMTLWDRMQVLGTDDPRFYTFAQIRELGGELRKGETSVDIFIWRQRVKVNTPVDGKVWFNKGDKALKKAFGGDLPEDAKSVPLLKRFWVFNASQCDGLPARPEPVRAEGDTLADVLGDGLRELDGLVPVSRYGDRAFYRPSDDRIVLPHTAAFDSVDAELSVYFHEYAHATGHPNRLARKTLMEYAEKDNRASEELVAESAAAFLMAALGRPYETRHAAYLASWARHLKAQSERERSSQVSKALSQGQAAADWLLAALERSKATSSNRKTQDQIAKAA